MCSAEPELGYYICNKPARELSHNPLLITGKHGATEMIPASSWNHSGEYLSEPHGESSAAQLRVTGSRSGRDTGKNTPTSIGVNDSTLLT